ncbi:MAG TPA: glycoside hydrolase family 32 protein, partial [Bryobacteraceae bacterium]
AAKVPTQPWRGQMTVPRRLQLKKIQDGLRLMQEPVEALQQLRGDHVEYHGENVAELNRALKTKVRWNSLELRSTAVPGAAGELGWKLLAADGKYTAVGYANGKLFMDRTHSGVVDFSPAFSARTEAPLNLGGTPLELTILVDRSTVEVFAQGEQVAMTNLVYPVGGARGIEFYTNGGKTGALRADVWELKSTWK